jgi:hypothetical protein
MLVSLWDEGGGSLWQALLYGHQGVASRPRKVSSRPAHVAIAPPLCPKVMVVEVKRKVVEKKGGKRGEVMAGQPSFGLHSPLPFVIHHILIPSCSNH